MLSSGALVSTYNIGGNSEIENIEFVRAVCWILGDVEQGAHRREELITFVADRPG